MDNERMSIDRRAAIGLGVAAASVLAAQIE
jgi:hypothetical protein